MKIRGVTLFELVIVIVILAILSISLAVKMITFNDIKLSSAAGKLAADISYAQQLAITTQVFHGAYLETANNQYFVFRDTTSTKVKDPYNRANDLIVNYNTATELNGVTIYAVNINSSAGVTFDGAGTPYDANKNILGSNGTITLKCGTSSKTVTITANTGKIIW